MSVIETVKTETGVTVTCAGESVTVDCVAFTRELLMTAAVHGVGQKLVDAAALSRNPENGQPATPAEKWARVKAIAERLNGGQWNAPKGERAIGGGMLLTAMREVFPKRAFDAAGLKAFVEEQAKAQGKAAADVRKALANLPKVKAVIDRLEAAQVKAVDGDALLAELE